MTLVPYPRGVRLVSDPTEEESVMELCRQLHSENGLFPLKEDKVRLMLRKAFNREGGVLGAVGEPGSLKGLIYMMMSSFWYSDAPHWEELFLYVKPEHRGGGAAVALMRFAKWCSANSGLPLVIGVLSNERTEGKVRLYQRNFDKPVGNFFFYSANGAGQALT